VTLNNGNRASFNKISGIYEVGITYWNKVIRVFIRAVRPPADSLAKGEIKGSFAGRKPFIF
jgi:hypothetical protein